MTSRRRAISCLCAVALGAVLATIEVRAAEPVALTPAVLERPEGVELTTGWLMARGDDPSWADAAFDDGAWEPVDPRLKVGALPTPNWDGAAWFRLRLVVDPALANRPLALEVRQAGASEIYLDGILVQKVGAIGTSALSERERNPVDLAIPLTFAEGGEHVLAVRYSCKAAPYVARGLDTLRPVRALGYGFTASLRSWGETVQFPGSALAGTIVPIGIVALALGFAACHGVLYRFFPAERSNRRYSVYAIGLAIMLFCSFVQNNGRFGLKGVVAFGLVLPLLYLLVGAAFQALLDEAFAPEAPHGSLLSNGVAVLATVVPIALPEATRIASIVVAFLLVGLFVRMVRTVRVGRAGNLVGWRWMAWSVTCWIALPVQLVIGTLFAVPQALTGLVSLACLLTMLVAPSVYVIQRFAASQRAVETRLSDMKALWAEQVAAAKRKALAESTQPTADGG